MPTPEKTKGFDSSIMASSLDELDHWHLDARWKGIPTSEKPLTLGDVPDRKWKLLAGDLPMPVAIVRQSALEANATWMKALLATYDVLLAPHAKTTMSPHLFAHQASYCWGLTVATAQQAEVAAHFGCRRLILANELIGNVQVTGIVRLLQRVDDLVVFVFVDTPEGVRELANCPGTQTVQQRLRLLIDVGFAGGRTGCRTIEKAKELLEEIASTLMSLGGVGGYEGLIATSTGNEDAERVERFFDLFEEIALLADRETRFSDGEIILTAGGSSYYDVVGRRLQNLRLSVPAKKILRSGCYVTHDCGTYHRHEIEMASRSPELAGKLGEMEPALFVCGLVQATQEADLAILTLGKRDVGIDADLPVPAWHFRKGVHNKPQPAPKNWTVFRLNDQHAYLRISPGDDIRTGDLIILGISHPCSTFDRWRLTHLVDDNWTSLGVMPTFF